MTARDGLGGASAPAALPATLVVHLCSPPGDPGAAAALVGDARGVRPLGPDGVGPAAGLPGTTGEVTVRAQDPAAVVAIVTAAARRGVAVGVGTTPALAARAARLAVRDPSGVVVRARGDRAALTGSTRPASTPSPTGSTTPDAGTAAADAGAVLAVLADLARRRTPAGQAVVDLLAAGRSRPAAARVLGVTRQAVSQRALAAGWRHERDLSALAARLLAVAAAPSPPRDAPGPPGARTAGGEEAGGPARAV